MVCAKEFDGCRIAEEDHPGGKTFNMGSVEAVFADVGDR